MNIRKKYLLVLPLLVVVMLPLLLSINYLFKEYAIKKEMEKKLEKSLLTTLTIPKKNVNWIENGKELVINGEMFDVKNYSVQNEYLIVCGLFDEYEKQLKKELSSHLTKDNTTTKSIKNLLLQIFTTYIIQQNKYTAEHEIYDQLQKRYCPFKSETQPAFITKITPPPNYLA